MPILRLPLAENLESRDGTTSKDALPQNCFVDKTGGGTFITKRFGTSIINTLPAGFGQGAFTLNGVDFFIIGDALYSSSGVNYPYTKPPTLGIAYQSVVSNNGKTCLFKTDYAAYKFDGTTVTQVSPQGGVSSITMLASGSGGSSGITLAWTNNLSSMSSPGYTNYNNLIAWNGTVFCAIVTYPISYGGTPTTIYTSPDGINWTARTIPYAANTRLAGIAWNGTVFCAISFGNGVVFSSADGISWFITGGLSYIPTGIAWNGTVFCVSVNNYPTGIAYTSPDGINWTARTIPGAPTGWSAIIWGGTKFCALSYSSGVTANSAATSPDGITWTLRTMPSMQSWNYIAWNGTVFCAIPYGTGTVSATSPDGITWTARTLPASNTWTAINSVSGVFCIVSSTNNNSYISIDGITWILMSIPLPSASWFALGNNGINFCSLSISGISTAVSTTPSGATYALGFSGGSGIGAAGTYTLSLAGSVLSTAITVSGTGYSAIAPSVSFPSGGISGANGTVNISGYPTKTVPGVAYLDGSYYVMESGTNSINGATNGIWGSGIEDPLTFNQLNYIQARSIAGNAAGITRYQNYIIALKSQSTEWLYDANNPAPGSPLGIVPSGLSKIGCASGKTMVTVDDNLIYVSQSSDKFMQVVAMNGQSPTTISTPAVDRIINQPNAFLTNVYAYSIKIQGHCFYVLTLVNTNITLAFDMTIKEWAIWTWLTINGTKSATLTYSNSIVTATVAAHGYVDGDIVSISFAAQYQYNGTFVISYIDANTFSYIPVTAPSVTPATGAILAANYTESYFPMTTYLDDGVYDQVLHESNGIVYGTSSALYQDNGVPINVKIRTNLFDGGNTNKKHFSKIEVVGDKINSTAYLRYSSDDYQSFCGYRPVYLLQGRSMLRRCGSSRRRSFELKHADNTPFRVESLELDIDKSSE